MGNHTSRQEDKIKLGQIIKKYERAANDLNKSVNTLQEVAISLWQIRVTGGVGIIKQGEDYLNRLAYAPQKLSQVINELKIAVRKIVVKDGGLSTPESPTFELREVMPFLSTYGTDFELISAVVAGCQGIGTKNLLLAMAGSKGWTIGAAALVGSNIWLNQECQRIAAVVYKRALEIEDYGETIDMKIEKVTLLKDFTVKLVDEINQELQDIVKNAPDNYQGFNQDTQAKLAKVINSIQILSQALQKNINLTLPNFSD